MKQLSSVLLIICLFILLGCSKNEPSKDTGKITFTVGSKNFSLTNINATVQEGFLEVTASNSEGEIFNISHRAGLAVGESSLTSQGLYYLSVIYMPRDGGSNYGPFADSPIGKFTITSIDKAKQTMTGTFDGVLVRYSNHADEIAISGSFTFPYTIVNESANDPYFLHKVNGQDFKGIIGSYGFRGTHLFFEARNGTEGISIQVYDDAVGTYAVGGIDINGTFARYWKGIDTYGSVSGTVTITSNQIGTTGLITGTYALELGSVPAAGNALSITEGTFTIQWP